MKSRLQITLILFSFWILQLNSASAQDLEPRRWTPLPSGLNVVGIGYSHTSGDLFFDPVLKIENAKVEADTFIVSYIKSITLAGKLARFDAIIPWQSTRWDGLLNGQPASAERKGLADPVFRLSLNLFGASASGANELTSESVNTVVGAAVSVSVPLGEYYEDKLLNLGQNRFIIKPQVGAVHTRGLWSYELTGSIYFFTDNNDFFNNSTREQAPVYAIQAHLIRIIWSGMWVSLSAGYTKGGCNTINGVSKNDEGSDVLYGIAIGSRITETQSIKIGYVCSRTREDTGADTDTLAISWSVMF